MKAIAIFLQLILFISCGNNVNHKIKLGISLPLTGTLSSFGQAELAGLQLALEENDKVELLVEDNKGDSKEAVNIAKRLTEIQKAKIFITSFSHLTGPIVNILEKQDVPLFYFALNNTFAKSSTNTHVFYVIYEDLAKVLGTYITSKPYSKGFYVGEMAEGCDLTFKEIKELTSDRIEFLKEERYLHTEQNLKPVAVKIQQSEPDFIYACSFRSQRALLKALYEADLTHLPLIQTFAYVSGDVRTEEIRNLYKHFNSISAWHAFSEVNLYEQNPELTSRILLKIKEKSHFSEALIAYELGKILGALVALCEASSECIREKAKTTTFPTSFGDVSFGSDRTVRLPVKMVTPEEFYTDFVKSETR